MTRTRNGKIARLDRDTRDLLNRRLENNEDGKTILAWLNALPETEKIVREDFSGVPISKQNLSEWRLGGFREWQTRRELLHQASETTSQAEDLVVPEGRLLVDDVAIVLSARYAALLSAWDGEPDRNFTSKLSALGTLVHDIVRLQRSIHRAHQRYLAEQAALDEASKQEIEDLREKTIAQILAPINIKNAADMYGGGKVGEYIAGLLHAAKHDLPPPKTPDFSDLLPPKGKTAPDRSGQTQSNPVKPKNPVKPSSDTTTAASPQHPTPPTPSSTCNSRGNETLTKTEPEPANENLTHSNST